MVLEETLDLDLKSLKRITAQSGYYLFKEGDEADCAYLIQSGTVDILKSREGSHVCIATIKRGDIIGELALIDNKPRSATAQVTKEAELLVVPRDVFHAHFRNLDPVVRRLLYKCVRLIRAMSDDKMGALLAQSGVTPLRHKSRSDIFFG